MYFLSCHRDVGNIGRGAKYKRDWVPHSAGSMAAVARAVSRFAWSPCQWLGGERLAANFGRANLLALDFDSGEMSLAQATRVFCDAVHVIGTTRSHRKEKGGIVADRFRVILALEDAVDDGATFAATAKFYAYKYDADPKAVDAARFFWPCAAIISVAEDGYRQETITPDPPDEERDPPKRYRESGVVRIRTHVLLRNVVPVGQRNDFCFTAAKDLYDAGYTAERIYAIILDSPTYQGQASSQTAREIQQCIRSAIKSVDGGRAYRG